MKKKIRFIINPKSGTGDKKEIALLVNRVLDSAAFEYDVFFTDAPGHATELAREAAAKECSAVISIGGDGSANEAARGLIGSRTALGIIPAGSGNGLARHLGIPMAPGKAILVIHSGKTEQVDTLKINDEICLGTMGVGFDAHVAHLFANSSKRGYATYAKLVLSEFYKYIPKKYELLIDDHRVERECFLLTFANSSQFGNNAVIAPFADLQDGIIDISMMSAFAFIFAPHLIWRLMNNTIHRSRFFSMMRGKNIVLKNNQALQAHIDGEPVIFNSDIHILIKPASLSVLVPSH